MLRADIQLWRSTIVSSSTNSTSNTHSIEGRKKVKLEGIPPNAIRQRMWIRERYGISSLPNPCTHSSRSRSANKCTLSSCSIWRWTILDSSTNLTSWGPIIWFDKIICSHLDQRQLSKSAIEEPSGANSSTNVERLFNYRSSFLKPKMKFKLFSNQGQLRL